MHLARPASLAQITPAGSTLAARLLAIVAATALVALCAHIAIPLPFTPVPLTLQPFAVILMGMLLGPVAGFASMLLYLAEGAAGLPVFTPQGPGGLLQLLGVTAGYLFSYPAAAALAGTIARSASSPRLRFLSALAAGAAASVLIYFFGALWLSRVHHLGAATVLHLAVLPFIPGEILKIIAAAGIFTALKQTPKSDQKTA